MKEHSLEEETLHEKIKLFRKKNSFLGLSSGLDSGKKQAISFFRVGSEFVSAIIASILIGIGIDILFDLQPWGVISLFILGSMAGFLNVLRVLKKVYHSRK